MKTTQEMIEVMQAYADGKNIQSRPRIGGGGLWSDVTPMWDWSDCDYRIKEEPKTKTLYYYECTKQVHQESAPSLGDVRILTRKMNFSLGNPRGMELIKTEEIELTPKQEG